MIRTKIITRYAFFAFHRNRSIYVFVSHLAPSALNYLQYQKNVLPTGHIELSIELMSIASVAYFFKNQM